MATRRQFLETGAFCLAAGFITRVASADESTGLPRALLLGDSISIGYTDFVIGMLWGKVSVARPLNPKGNYENCEGTTKGIAKIDDWLGNGDWDVIHFNFGLHDLKHVDGKTGRNSRNPQDPQQATLDQYEKNLQQIVAKLVATKAKLIFATTTPFLANPGGPWRDADQPQKYNEVAIPIMKRNGVAIDDLYGFALPHINEFFPRGDVHPTKAGSRELAQQVVAHIRTALQL